MRIEPGREEATRYRYVGKCYVCGTGVQKIDAQWIPDHAVKLKDGRPLRRLVHRGRCNDRAATMLGGNRIG